MVNHLGCIQMAGIRSCCAKRPFVKTAERHRPRKDAPIPPWVLTSATFVSHFLSCGVSFSLGVYYVVFLEVFRESNGMTSWIGSLNLGTLCAAGPLASYMIEKLGSRSTVMIGGVLASLGLGVSAFAPNIFVMFLSLGLVTGLGYGMVFTASIVVIGTSLTKHRTLAMGIAISGIGLGNFAYPFLARYLMVLYGWRGALLITAAITANICFFGMFMKMSIPEEQTEDLMPLAGEPERNELPMNGQLKTSETAGCVTSTPALPRLSLVKDRQRLCGSTLLPAQSSERLSSSMYPFDWAVHHSRSELNKLNGNFTSLQHIPLRNKHLLAGITHSDYDICSKTRNPSLDNVNRAYLTTKTPHSVHPLFLNGHIHDDDEETELRSSESQSSGLDESGKLYPFFLVQYWLLHINTVLFCFSLSVVLAHVYAYAISRKVNEDLASLVISLNGAANVVGRLVLGAIAQHPVINTRWLFVVCYTTAGVGVLLLTVWTSFVGMTVSMVIFGTFSAAFGPILSEVTMEIVGVRHFNFGYGFLMISMALGTILGAPTAGWLYDITDHYTSSFYLGSSILVTSAVIISPPIVKLTNWTKTSGSSKSSFMTTVVDFSSEE